jgi:hypothetical protein
MEEPAVPVGPIIKRQTNRVRLRYDNGTTVVSSPAPCPLKSGTVDSVCPIIKRGRNSRLLAKQFASRRKPHGVIRYRPIQRLSPVKSFAARNNNASAGIGPTAKAISSAMLSIRV